MKITQHILRYLTIGIFSIALLFGSQSCSKLFEYSPYSANVENDQLNTNAIQLQGIANQFKCPTKFSFAVIADVHYHYTSLASIVKQINNDEEIDFVIIAGDISDQALLTEYELFYSIMKDLNKPYLTLIGNHDYNANGEKIYAQMFGETNYDFSFQNSHFVMFDDVFWESNRIPDFDWLESKLQNQKQYEHQFVIAHIPPFGDQFDDESEARYSKIMKDNKVSLSIHGHTHSYLSKEYYQDGIPYLVVPWPKNAEYSKISVNEETIIYKIEKA